MRGLGIPWFDRIERISIYVDKKMPTETLNAMTRLHTLKSIELDNPTQGESVYLNAIAASQRKIQLTNNRR